MTLSKTIIHFACCIGALSFLVPSILVAAPATDDARSIMDKVFNRAAGEQLSANASMIIKDTSEKVKTKSFNVRSMNSAKDARIFVNFSAPSDVKGTKILSIDYIDADKTDDQWIYIPKLRKSTRISNNNRSGSFMGSDFSYSDMTKSNPSLYNYKVVDESSKIGSTDCWLIEETPITETKAAESGYTKSLHWIAKDSFITLRIKAWEYKSSRIKFMKFEKIKKVNGVYVIHKMSAQTKDNGKVVSDTVLQFTNLNSAGNQFTENDFSTRQLEQ